MARDATQLTACEALVGATGLGGSLKVPETRDTDTSHLVKGVGLVEPLKADVTDLSRGLAVGCALSRTV